MAKTELETAFSNVTALVQLASWHLLENMNRGDGETYALKHDAGVQLEALLVVTADYAGRVLDGRGAS